jgi:hypothetical protein
VSIYSPSANVLGSPIFNPDALRSNVQDEPGSGNPGVYLC